MEEVEMTYDPHKAHEYMKEGHKEIFEKSQKTSNDLLSQWEAEAKASIEEARSIHDAFGVETHRDSKILALIQAYRVLHEEVRMQNSSRVAIAEAERILAKDP